MLGLVEGGARVEGGVRAREVLFIKMFAETRLAPLRRAAAPPPACEQGWLMK